MFCTLFAQNNTLAFDISQKRVHLNLCAPKMQMQISMQFISINVNAFERKRPALNSIEITNARCIYWLKKFKSVLVAEKRFESKINVWMNALSGAKNQKFIDKLIFGSFHLESFLNCIMWNVWYTVRWFGLVYVTWKRVLYLLQRQQTHIFCDAEARRNHKLRRL